MLSDCRSIGGPAATYRLRLRDVNDIQGVPCPLDDSFSRTRALALEPDLYVDNSAQ